jgi:hypothetical protein
MQDLPLTYLALRGEAAHGSNETIPLWLPTLARFGRILTEDGVSEQELMERFGFGKSSRLNEFSGPLILMLALS